MFRRPYCREEGALEEAVSELPALSENDTPADPAKLMTIEVNQGLGRRLFQNFRSLLQMLCDGEVLGTGLLALPAFYTFRSAVSFGGCFFVQSARILYPSAHKLLIQGFEYIRDIYHFWTATILRKKDYMKRLFIMKIMIWKKPGKSMRPRITGTGFLGSSLRP